MNLYVGNISYDATEEDVKDAFAVYGDVASVKLITDRETGRLKGFGFVEMADEDSAKKAMNELDGSDLKGRPLKVNEAREKKDRR